MHLQDILNKKTKFVDEMEGRDKVYIFEPVEEVSLEIKKILVSEHFYPISFKKIDDFIEKFNEEKTIPKIFFISVVEPEGFELIKTIKKDSQYDGIPVIASGILRRNEKEASEAGVDLYISKPLIWIIMPFLIRTLIFINDLKKEAEEEGFGKDIKLKFNSKSDVIAEITF